MTVLSCLPSHPRTSGDGGQCVVMQMPSCYVGWVFTMSGQKKTMSTLNKQNNVVTENCQMVIQIERGGLIGTAAFVLHLATWQNEC